MSLSETCDCTTEESSSLQKDLSCELETEKQDHNISCQILELEISKSVLNFVPSNISNESSVVIEK
jgi:hypothetical protein